MIRDRVVLDEATLRGVAASYSILPKPLLEADRRALKAALRLAKGNERRLTIEGDGSITVHNNPVW